MLGSDLKPVSDDFDVLLGDSLGEMYFYLALSKTVIVGGGFVPTGARNIIEPLALKKMVLVGPNIWTIAYPAQEAIESGALTSVDTIEELEAEIVSHGGLGKMTRRQNAVELFYAAHTGAASRTLHAIDALLK